ncbi:MAG: tolQ [Gammaproteobacteria bacterium]|jgi:biopolymer transport protein TolQ|nr:tolQ [Gammaproteobacteria bacterium]
MVSDASLWSFVADAGLVVKVVMLMLLAASLLSWTFIFQHGAFLKRAKSNMISFEDRFWSGRDLSKLYEGLSKKGGDVQGLESIFHAGFHEYTRMNQSPGMAADALMASVERAMRVAQAREMDKLEQHLSFLATVGSTSPYVGLFGTVWGIMTSFQALSTLQQATIAMVAPGISEALIATAMGLFAAIPAVIAYNRFNSDVERLANAYDTFQEEFSGILYRQAHLQAQESATVRRASA